MPSLRDTIAAIVSDVARGRVHADIASAEVAVIYKEHPILREFPLPYMTIDRVDIDLKVALQPRDSMSQTDGVVTTDAQRIEQHGKLVAILQNVPNLLKRYDVIVGSVGRKWLTIQRSLGDQLREYVLSSTHLPPAVQVAEVTCRIHRGIREMIASDPVAMQVVKTRPDRLEAVEHEIVVAVEPVLNIAPAGAATDPIMLDVLLSPVELREIDVNKLTSIHIVLGENDKRLTSVRSVAPPNETPTNR